MNAASLPFGTAVDNDNPQTEDIIASEKYSKVKGKGKEKEKTSAPSTPKLNGRPLVSVAAVVGGMSLQKQRRILSRGADVLVATPGRLWDIIQEVCQTWQRFSIYRLLGMHSHAVDRTFSG